MKSTTSLGRKRVVAPATSIPMEPTSGKNTLSGMLVKSRQPSPLSMRGLVDLYQKSPDWTNLAPASQRVYSYGLRVWQGITTPVQALKRSEVIHIRDDMPSGMARMFVIITSRLCSFAVDNGYMNANPVVKMKRPRSNPRKRWPEAVVNDVLARATGDALNLLKLGLLTGQRVSDIVLMRNANLEGGLLRVVQQKTKAVVWIPMDPFDEVLVSSGKASRLFSQELRRLKVYGYTFHGIRKTVAATMAERGATAEEIAAVLGHSSIVMASYYTKEADKKKLALSGFRRIRSG